MPVSPVQIAAWSRNAGFSGLDQVTSVAVALAVGGGAPPGKGVPEAAQGAWGIGGGGDGQAQASVAFATWKQSGWGAFPTHRNGAFAFWMPVATAVEAAIGADMTVTNPVGTAKGVIQQAENAVPNPVKNAVEPFLVPLHFIEDPGTWLRFAKIVAGLGLIVVGGFKFGLENIFGVPYRLVNGVLNEGGNQVAEGAALVGLFSRRGAAPAAQAAAPAAATRSRPAPAKRAAPTRSGGPAPRKRTAPPAESPRVAAARRMLREADAAKRRKRDEEHGKGTSE